MNVIALHDNVADDVIFIFLFEPVIVSKVPVLLDRSSSTGDRHHYLSLNYLGSRHNLKISKRATFVCYLAQQKANIPVRKNIGWQGAIQKICGATGKIIFVVLALLVIDYLTNARKTFTGPLLGSYEKFSHQLTNSQPASPLSQQLNASQFQLKGDLTNQQHHQN